MPKDFKNLPWDVYKHFYILCEKAYGDVLSDRLAFYKHELPDDFEHMDFMNEWGNCMWTEAWNQVTITSFT